MLGEMSDPLILLHCPAALANVANGGGCQKMFELKTCKGPTPLCDSRTVSSDLQSNPFIAPHRLGKVMLRPNVFPHAILWASGGDCVVVTAVYKFSCFRPVTTTCITAVFQRCFETNDDDGGVECLHIEPRVQYARGSEHRRMQLIGARHTTNHEKHKLVVGGGKGC